MRTLFFVLVALLIAALGGCGSGSDEETGVRIGNSSAWSVQSVSAPRMLTVGTRVGYCVGDPKPRIGRPEVEYLNDDVFITLTVEKPPAQLAKPNEVCAGVDLFVGRTITLKRDLEDVRVFDGGVDPPLQRWPN